MKYSKKNGWKYNHKEADKDIVPASLLWVLVIVLAITVFHLDSLILRLLE